MPEPPKWRSLSFSSPRQIRKAYTFQWAKSFVDNWKVLGVEAKDAPEPQWDEKSGAIQVIGQLKLPEGSSLLTMDGALKSATANKTGMMKLEGRWPGIKSTDGIGRIVPPDGQPVEIGIEAVKNPKGEYILAGAQECDHLEVVAEYLGDGIPADARFQVSCEATEGDQVRLKLTPMAESIKPSIEEGGWKKEDQGLAVTLAGFDAPSEPLTVESVKIRFVRQKQPNRRWWAHGSVLVIGGYQFVAAGNQLSAQAEWNPRFRIKERWGITGWIGGAPLKSVTTGGYFFAARYGVEGNLYLPRGWIVGLGGGAQTWVTEIGTSPSFRLSVTKIRGETDDHWRWIDRFTGNVEYTLVSGMAVLEAKVGIEMGRTR